MKVVVDAVAVVAATGRTKFVNKWQQIGIINLPNTPLRFRGTSETWIARDHAQINQSCRQMTTNRHNQLSEHIITIRRHKRNVDSS